MINMIIGLILTFISVFALRVRYMDEKSSKVDYVITTLFFSWEPLLGLVGFSYLFYGIKSII